MGEHGLGDQRLRRRVEQLRTVMVEQQRVSVAGLAGSRAEQIAYYRLLSNERVSEAALVETLAARARAAVTTLPGAVHLLAIQDTTQLNFEAHRGRLKSGSGLGVIGDGRSMGFFLHPTLLIDAQRGQALGFSDVRLWSREVEAPNKHARRYKQLPLEAKESVRWVESPQHSRTRMGAQLHLTSIADREGDLYPLFARVPDARTDLLVRVCRDHRIEESSAGLYTYLAAPPLLGVEEVEIRGDVRKTRTARRARLEYRSVRVHLPRPPLWKREAARTGPLWAIEVREVPETVPAGETPIHWRLLSTHTVESFAQARQVVAWYRERWNIEQTFRLLKLDGLDLESSELETGTALRRLSLLALDAALGVLRLLLAERGENEQPLAQLFSATEQACLGALTPRLEGKTAKQQNPHPPQTLAWAAWSIARLGGWKGYRSQHAAGPATYHRGLARFHSLCQGYLLATHVLCTP